MQIVEIWRNLEKKRNTDYNFPPIICGRKIVLDVSGEEKKHKNPGIKSPKRPPWIFWYCGMGEFFQNKPLQYYFCFLGFHVHEFQELD